MSDLSYNTWTQDDISRWLGSLNLHHLIPNFERIQMDGARLMSLSDQELKSKFRMKPAEVMAIRGAINKLVDDSIRHSKQNRKISNNPKSPSSSRDRTASLEPNIHMLGDNRKGLSKTVPRADAHRNTISTDKKAYKQPKLIPGSAPELLDKECKYSGWIRKQGGGYKNWKRRYLVLRIGCLYYFANETASSAKGSFVLSGYATEICREPEIIKKYKYTLKLCPMNPQVRTYYISVGSEHELVGWKDAIDSEIKSVSRTTTTSLNTRQESSVTNNLSSYDDDDDDDDEDNPYDIPEGVDFDGEEEDHNYEDPATIYDKPDGQSNSEEDDDDPYTKIDETNFPLGRDGKPTVPSRSAFSLQSPTNTLSPSLPTQLGRGGDSPLAEETYLSIIGAGPAVDPAAAQPDFSRSMPTNIPSDFSIASNNGDSVLHDNSDYEDDAPEDSGGDDDGGYYIMFRKPEELMPPSCLFDRLDRAEADRLLKEKDRDGTYLIRGGSHAGAEKVLSVWHIDRCRHYKLFKDDNSSYSLTQGQSFRTIPELLQYYTLQSHLPRSDFYLGDPFNSKDH